MDRLAKRAGISPGLVYSFAAGKEGLFEAVYRAIAEQTVNAIPIDADDLAEYAGRLHDAGQQHPQVMRFLTWYALESTERPVPDIVARSMQDKIASVEAAQQRGSVRRDKPAAEILALANMWQHQAEDVNVLISPARRRATVTEAVRRLVTPD